MVMVQLMGEELVTVGIVVLFTRGLPAERACFVLKCSKP